MKKEVFSLSFIIKVLGPLSVLIFIVSLASLSPASGAEEEFLEELKKIVSLEDMPPGFRLEGGYSMTPDELGFDSREARLVFKGTHPFSITVRLEHNFYAPSTLIKYDWVLEDLEPRNILSRNLGIGEKSLHWKEYMSSRDRNPFLQNLRVYQENWVLSFSMSHYNIWIDGAPYMTDEEAGRFLTSLAKKVFDRFLGLEREPMEIIPMEDDYFRLE